MFFVRLLVFLACVLCALGAQECETMVPWSYTPYPGLLPGWMNYTSVVDGQVALGGPSPRTCMVAPLAIRAFAEQLAYITLCDELYNIVDRPTVCWYDACEYGMFNVLKARDLLLREYNAFDALRSNKVLQYACYTARDKIARARYEVDGYNWLL